LRGFAGGPEPITELMTEPITEAIKTRPATKPTAAEAPRARRAWLVRGACRNARGSTSVDRRASPAGWADGCMAAWIAAESSPQKSSAPAGAGPASSSGSKADATACADGPNGTSSSIGPIHSRGRRTTLLAVCSPPPPSSVCRSSVCTGFADLSLFETLDTSPVGVSIRSELVPVCLN
jgi:hypothetical protein